MITALLAVIIIFTGNIAYAGPAEDAWEAYLSGNFTQVASIVDRHLDDADLTNIERSRLYLALGCSDAILGREASATAAFERSLILNSSLSVTEADLPPPAWKLFKPVMDRQGIQKSFDLIPILKEGDKSEKSIPDTVKILIPFERDRGALIKSVAFPGWGHLSEGNKRGYLFVGAEVTAVAGLLYSIIKVSDARDSYLKERDSARIESKYDRYNFYHNLSWGFGISTVAIYLAAQFDLISGSPAITFSNAAAGSNQLSLSFTL